jgi:hypothetical protein
MTTFFLTPKINYKLDCAVKIPLMDQRQGSMVTHLLISALSVLSGATINIISNRFSKKKVKIDSKYLLKMIGLFLVCVLTMSILDLFL